MKPDKFSLDYVESGSRAGKSDLEAQRGDSALNQATIVFSEPILQQLRSAQSQQMRLHDLIEKVNAERPVASIEEFQGVIDRLVSLGFIEIRERDIRGNHLLHLLQTA